MSDKELIQNLRICGNSGNCIGCELDGYEEALVHDDDFCSYGERKGGARND